MGSSLAQDQLNRLNGETRVTIDIAVEQTQQPKQRPNPNDYGFGRYFTDHMFMADYSEVLKWHAPRVVPYQNLRLDPGAAVLHYGQALFEGMKAFHGIDGKVRLFRPEMNWKRLQAGAERLCMQAPPLDVFLEGIQGLLRTDRDWIPMRPGTALYLRPTLIGTESFLGVRPSENYLYYVIASPVGAYYGEGLDTVKIWIEREFARAAPGGIGAVKAGGNYASSLRAALQAKKRGYMQVLWLDACHHRYVEEVGTMNVFFVIGDKVVTPSLSGTILPGVMRDSVIQLLKSWNRPLEERPIELEEVLTAHASGELKEVFGTGTAAQISPVSHLGTHETNYTIGDGQIGSVSRELYKYFMDLNYGRGEDSLGWLMDVF